MDQYRTSGVMDEAALREVEKYLFRSRLDWGCWIAAAIIAVATLIAWIAAAIIAVVALLAWIVRDWFHWVLYLALAAFFFLCPRFLQNRYIKTQLNRMREDSPEGVARYESFFTVDGITLQNRSHGGGGLYSYNCFARTAETNRYFLIITKSSQFFLVFKDCLTPEQRESFLPFLKERCPKLKIMR